MTAMGRGGRDRLARFIRFVLVGLISNGCLLGLFFALTTADVRPVWASMLVYLLGVGATYAFHRFWSFRSSALHRIAAPRYVITHVIGASLQSALLFIGHDGLKFHPLMVQAAAMAVVAGFVFISLEFFTFASRPVQHPPNAQTIRYLTLSQ
jgi:putative flippase GtrA